MTLAVAAGLALLSALLAAVGTVIRQQATGSSGVTGRAWFVGAAVSVGAFALQVAALVVGTVLLVQPLIVLSVLFELFIQVWWMKRSPTRRQWLFGTGVAVGVVAFVVFASPVPAQHGRQVWLIDVVLLGVLGLVLTAYLVARKVTGPLSAVLFGTVAGSLFGIVAVQITSLSEPFRGVLPTLTNLTFYFCLLTCFGAIVAQQRAFTKADLEASYPAMVASEPVVAMVLSMVVLGEKLSSHDVGTYLAGAGVVLMILCVVGLARETATVGGDSGAAGRAGRARPALR